MTPSREGDSDDPTPDVPLDHKDNVDRDAAFGGHTARSPARSRRNRSPHIARPRGSAHVARCGVRTRRKAQDAFTGRHSPILSPSAVASVMIGRGNPAKSLRYKQFTTFFRTFSIPGDSCWQSPEVSAKKFSGAPCGPKIRSLSRRQAVRQGTARGRYTFSFSTTVQ